MLDCENSDIPDSSSLADARDFNRSPRDLPSGAKKHWFPDVYPKYALPEPGSSTTKRSRASSPLGNQEDSIS